MNLEDARQIWGEEWTHDIDVIDEAILQAGLSENARVLDVGTGFGIMATSLAVGGYDVLTGEPEDDTEWREGLEDHEGHGHADFDWREAARKLGVEHRITFQHFDARELPFPDGSFDGVFLYDALQHIGDRAAALSECIRVTAPGGMVCVIETNRNGIRHFEETEGFTIDYVDPRNLIRDGGILVEVVEGELSDAYVLRRT
jgi:SAM-dependent methyltransferase